jgi:cobalt/nickel transport system permease protein
MLVPVLAMHIPDGFLSLPVSAVGWLLLLVMIALALRQTRHDLSERQIPLMGVLAAFVFAAQMINFPVAGGTSGHLLGGALLAILVGPWASVLALTCVLGVQAFIFQDGGLLALGFNAFNMGVIGVFVAAAVYQQAARLPVASPLKSWIGAALAAWISVMAAAAATALELALSQTVALDVALPAMLSVHALIGVGEALITVGALAFIQKARPDVIRGSEPRVAAGSGWIAAGLMIALAFTLFSPLADPNPDGLERVAEDQGFSAAADEAPYSILPDYTVPLIENEAASTVAAGVFGTLMVAGVSYAVSRSTRKPRERMDT